MNNNNNNNKLIDYIFSDEKITTNALYGVIYNENEDIETIQNVLKTPLKNKNVAGIINYIGNQKENAQKAIDIYKQFSLEQQIFSLRKPLFENFDFSILDSVIEDGIKNNLEIIINVKNLNKLSDSTLNLIDKYNIEINSKKGLDLSGIIDNPDKYAKLIVFKKTFFPISHFSKNDKIVRKRKSSYSKPINQPFIQNFREYFNFLTYKKSNDEKCRIINICRKRMTNFDEFLKNIGCEDLLKFGD